jgi:hypothetical protein
MVRLTLAKSLMTFALALRLIEPSQQASMSSIPEADQPESMEMRGTVGPYRIGLNYTVQKHTDLIAAHYFYVSQLKNIPLKGAVNGDSVDLEGADGSKFHLHFVGNGSNGTQALTFYNSVGLKGSWTLGNRSFLVDLRMQHSTENPGQPLYRQVTDQPDSAYEAMVTKTREAILSGNETETAKCIHFPLRVNGTHHPLTIRNEDELKANWSKMFTPEFLAKLRTDVPHEMFVHNGEAMLGDGELWFDDKGLVALNPVLGEADLVKTK